MVENEYWKSVKGYEGIYEISSFGRVKRLELRCTDKNGVNYCKKERITLGSKTKEGYIRLGLTKNGKRIKYLIHRLMGEAFLSNPENKEQINHINGVKDCNRVWNLEWVTHSENIKHAYDVLGFDNKSRKLTDEDVTYIRSNYKYGNGGELAIKFNVTNNCILMAAKGKTFKKL